MLLALFLLYFGEYLIDDVYRISSYVISGLSGIWLFLWITKSGFKQTIGAILNVSLMVIGGFALVVGIAETG